MVECFLAKEDVAGSTPVSRSKNPLPAVHFTYNSEGLQVNSPPEARYPSGKGEVCKTFMRRFDPDPRLQRICKLEALRVRRALYCRGYFPADFDRPWYSNTDELRNHGSTNALCWYQ